jgi:hypothetical protein
VGSGPPLTAGVENPTPTGAGVDLGRRVGEGRLGTTGVSDARFKAGEEGGVAGSRPRAEWVGKAGAC